MFVECNTPIQKHCMKCGTIITDHLEHKCVDGGWTLTDREFPGPPTKIKPFKE